MADILGPDGRPFRKQELLEELATPSVTGVRQAWSIGSVAATLTPSRLVSLLQSAAQGDMHDYLVLAEEMEEKDAHYAAVLGTRKRAISGLPVVVEAASETADDVAMADEVRALTDTPDFAELVDDLLDALGKGFSAAEIRWKAKNRKLIPGGYSWCDPRWFQFDQATGRELLLRTDAHPNGEPIPPGKLVIHKPRLKSGVPIRGGIARLVAVSYLCKAYTLKDWMRYAEVFGMPLRIGRYGPGAKADDIAVLRRAVSQIASDAAAVLPDSMKIEFQEIANAAGGAELFARLAEWLDEQISKAVIGQTMTADSGASLAQAKIHNEVRLDIVRADAHQLAVTLNRDLIRPYIDLNYGPQKRYPKIRFGISEPEDLQALVTALEKLVPMGLKVEASAISDRLGLPDPDPKAVLLHAPSIGWPSEPALNREQQCSCCGLDKALNRSTPDADVDDLIQEELEDWQRIAEPVLDPIQKLAREAETFEEFLSRLPGLLNAMDDREVIERLAQAAFKARVLGNVDA